MATTRVKRVAHWDRDHNKRAVCGASASGPVVTTPNIEDVTCPACNYLIDGADDFEATYVPTWKR